MNLNNEFKLSDKSDMIAGSLPVEKRKLIEKHSLKLSEKMVWVTIRENSFPRKICRHAYMEKSDILGLLFRLNEVCFAKVNYFRSHLASFEPLKYHYIDGFETTELWDADFFRHRVSGLIFDFRYLNSIKDIEKFRELCTYIESLEQKRGVDIEPDDIILPHK